MRIARENGLATRTHPSHWKAHFPDYDSLPPLIRDLRDRGVLRDVSYRNDVCPSFIHENDYFRMDSDGSVENIRCLWVDYADPRKRENPEQKRYVVQRVSDGATLETDDETAAIDALNTP